MAVKKRNSNRVWPDFLDYFRQDFRREILGWVTVSKYFGLIIPLIIALLIALIIYINPFTPKKAFLATGQEGSSYSELAEKFAAFFKQNGVELELIKTPSLEQGLIDLSNAKSRVNASFMTAWSTRPGQYPELVSLGSIQYAPVWIFYREKIKLGENPFAALMTQKMAIGTEGTNTQKILKKMLSLNGLELTPRSNLFELSNQEAANRFVDGDLDAVFIVDGIESPNVRKLLSVPDVKIFDFSLATAYVKNLPFLGVVKIPRGALDIKNIYPPEEITMLASTVTLLVEKDMHPAIQWLFILAAKNISADGNQFFEKAKYFPVYSDHNIGLSEIAKRYYEAGIPPVFDYFSVAMASLIDRIWVILLALVLAIIPLFKLLLTIREYPSGKLLYDFWQDLRDFEHDLELIETRADAQLLVDQLEELAAAVIETWFEDDVLHRYFGLKKTIAEVREKANKRLAEFA